MPTFFYTAKNPSTNQTVQGSLDASSRQQAYQKIRLLNLIPISIQDSPPTSSSSSTIPSWLSKLKSSSSSSHTPKNIAQPFLSKVLQLHKSGMPLGDCIKTLRDRLSDPAQKEIASKIWQDLSEGLSFASSLAKFPDHFDNTIIFSIEAGEATGHLAPILEDIVDRLQKQADLKKKIYSALAYPIFICCVAITVICLFLFYLLPKIQNMMSTLGGKMALPARVLIASADILIYLGPIVLLFAIFAAFYIQRWRLTPKGLLTTDSWLIRLPFIKDLILGSVITDISNITATLLSSGINTTETLSLVEKLISNSILRQRFKSAQKQINEGMSVSKAFKSNLLFPDLAIDILTIGENTGNLADSFKEISTIYREELTENLKKMTTTISSAALLVAFSLVSILALSIVTSILQFSNTLVK